MLSEPVQKENKFNFLLHTELAALSSLEMNIHVVFDYSHFTSISWAWMK